VLALTAFGLAVGIGGYAHFEGMSLIDAFPRRRHDLLRHGPGGRAQDAGGQGVRRLLPIFSGLIIVIATGLVLTPIFHRVLHKFHVETSKDS
jgi:hypothetical protein